MERVRCARCSEVIGVYEPVRMVLRGGGEFSGSLLTLHSELERPGSIALHATCHPDFPERSGDE
jgi:hypothetical protein